MIDLIVIDTVRILLLEAVGIVPGLDQEIVIGAETKIVIETHETQIQIELITKATREIEEEEIFEITMINILIR
jgi:hypothetical protein